MKTIKIFVSIVLLLCLFTNCKEQEFEEIYSELDGDEYLADMCGEMNTRKAARLIIENKIDKVPIEFQVLIADSLSTNDAFWKRTYLEALSKTIGNFNESQRRAIGASLFNFFIHQPKLFQDQVKEMDFENSDLFLELMSIEINKHLQDQQITINSIINLAIKYCENCNDSNIDFLIKYVELAQKLVIE